MSAEPHGHPVWVLLDKMQMDHREQGKRLVELRAWACSLQIPDRHVPVTCEGCGMGGGMHTVDCGVWAARPSHKLPAERPPKPPYRAGDPGV